jgi:hypothetical protein
MSIGNSARGPVRARRHHRAGGRGQPPRQRLGRAALAPEQGTAGLGGWHARRFTSSLITVMIRKEGTYVRAMRLAPARQLTLDIPGPERGGGSDPGRVWDQMPDTARARVLRLLAAMIAAGVLIDDTGAVSGDD